MPDNTEKNNPVPGRNQALPDGVSGAHILVVDDMPIMRKMIGMCLERGGFSNIAYAEDGDDALEQIAEAAPDLVILDINMPRLSGYDVCKQLRADEATSDLPILVQSASETAEERVEVFAVGATDFVSKPINQPELLARVCMHLENRFLIRSLSDFQDRMQTELNMAREMQHSLLPEAQVITQVEETGNAKIEAFYKASSELGGDLWGVWPLGDNKLGIYVLDVTGHGVGAALNTFSLHATMARFESLKRDPAKFLDALNSSLVGSFQLGRFATMFYGVLDCETSEFLYAGAGAPRPIIFGPNGNRRLDSSGLPVAILKSATYENRLDKLEPGESLFCYSDVLVEAEQQSGGILGEDGLVQWVEDAAKSGPRNTVVERLLDRFYAEQDEMLPDDLTAVAIHRAAGNTEANTEFEDTPTVLVIAGKDSPMSEQYDKLASPGMRVHRTALNEMDPGVVLGANSDYSAIVIDGGSGFDRARQKLSHVDSAFIEAGGPVVLVLDGEPDPNDDILSFDRARYFDGQKGGEQLRRFLAQEANDYVRICALKAALAAREPDEQLNLGGSYRFTSRKEAQQLAMMFSQASKDPVPLAIGLSELFINAIEHGCLEIGHNEKGELIEKGLLNEEVRRRRNSEKYRHQFAMVKVSQIGSKVEFRVEDPGSGFDFAAYLADEDGHSKKHGRGISMAKGCFASLAYEGKGNIAIAKIELQG